MGASVASQLLFSCLIVSAYCCPELLTSCKLFALREPGSMSVCWWTDPSAGLNPCHPFNSWDSVSLSVNEINNITP